MTKPNHFQNLLDTIRKVPNLQVKSSHRKGCRAYMALRADTYRAIQFVRDMFTAGWKSNDCIVSWSCIVYDSAYASDEAIYFGVELNVVEGKCSEDYFDICLFWSSREAMKRAYLQFGIKEKEV